MTNLKKTLSSLIGCKVYERIQLWKVNDTK